MTTALPVAIDLADTDLADDVRAHVESRLGWQVVDPGPHLPVRLLLGDDVHTSLPTVIVAWQTPTGVVRDAMQAGALDVLAWPQDADRLADLPPDSAPTRPADVLIAVSAASRGVGTSTVALALSGLCAWLGRDTVTVTDAAGRRLAGMAAEGVEAVSGIDRLRVAPSVHSAVAHGPPDVLVADVSTDRRGHVLVGRPDRALAVAVADLPGDAAVITVGEGGLRPAELRRVVGHRPHAALAWSFRVARAGLSGRVPVALPGRWMADLRPVLAGLLGGDGR